MQMHGLQVIGSRSHQATCIEICLCTVWFFLGVLLCLRCCELGQLVFWFSICLLTHSKQAVKWRWFLQHWPSPAVLGTSGLWLDVHSCEVWWKEWGAEQWVGQWAWWRDQRLRLLCYAKIWQKWTWGEKKKFQYSFWMIMSYASNWTLKAPASHTPAGLCRISFSPFPVQRVANPHYYACCIPWWPSLACRWSG